MADERNVFVVPEDGKIVAWSIGLGKPTPEQISFFGKNYGGQASARLTVLRPGKTLYSRTVTQTPVADLCSRTSGRWCSFRSAARSTSRRAMSSP